MNVLKVLAIATAALAGMTTASLAQSTTLRLAHIFPAGDVYGVAARKLADEIGAKTAGAINVQVFPAGTLGQEREMLEGLRLGSLNMLVSAGSVLINASKTATIFDIHFMLNDFEHFGRVFDGPIGQEIAQQVEAESGYRILAYWLRGPRWVTSKKIVNTPKDLAGLKIRVPDSAVYVEAWRALGAAPTPMNFGEVYSALQQGVVDAQENPLALIHSAKFASVAPYLVRTEHHLTPILVTVDARQFDQLPASQRKAIQDAANGAVKTFVDQEVRKQEVDLIARLQKDGMKLVEVDKKPFQEVVAPLVGKRYPEIEPLYTKIVGAGH